MEIELLLVDSLYPMYLHWFLRMMENLASMFSVQSMSASGVSCLIMACLIAIFKVLSKAPSVSKKAPMAYSFASSCLSTLPTRLCNAVSVDLPSL